MGNLSKRSRVKRMEQTTMDKIRESMSMAEDMGKKKAEMKKKFKTYAKMRGQSGKTDISV